ncbi:uncharacterized protein A4U43_C01F24330 [Asparagus officinalis]|uniref:Uncharacterized protein n=1 Tax=Asparagus officinalis TaxID=4686 RepID=A0A5P1FRT1_ASPOF|nr:uncharacterized protein A4U43_C01F24330 [Asparagus officinalis]
MVGLQRSAMTFRRSGSSGLVWGDRFFLDEQSQKSNKFKDKENDDEVREMKPSKDIRFVHDTVILPPTTPSKSFGPKISRGLL